MTQFDIEPQLLYQVQSTMYQHDTALQYHESTLDVPGSRNLPSQLAGILLLGMHGAFKQLCDGLTIKPP
jgi:hypothetical protein